MSIIILCYCVLRLKKFSCSFNWLTCNEKYVTDNQVVHKKETATLFVNQNISTVILDNFWSDQVPVLVGHLTVRIGIRSPFDSGFVLPDILDNF